MPADRSIERLVGISIENEWEKTGTWAKFEKNIRSNENVLWKLAGAEAADEGLRPTGLQTLSKGLRSQLLF